MNRIQRVAYGQVMELVEGQHMLPLTTSRGTGLSYTKLPNLLKHYLNKFKISDDRNAYSVLPIVKNM